LTARALKPFAPDIITLQEGPAEPLVKRFATELGMHYVWFPGGWKGNEQYPGGFPGAVVTRYPIIESESRPSAGAPHDGTLFTRHLGSAALDTPFGKLHVVSVHFHASDHDARMREAAAAVALIQNLHASGPVLLQGDLNHRPEDPEYAVWRDAGLVDVAAQHGTGQAPTFSSTNPKGRIDYIWATPDLGRTSMHAEVLNAPPFVPEPADAASYALSDHMPVLADFDTSRVGRQ
jgi:endonuclease/exonuclease/phosphatase family metal-dependent hydrolase